MERKNYGDVGEAIEMGALYHGDSMKEVFCAEEILLTEFLLPTVAAMRLAFFFFS